MDELRKQITEVAQVLLGINCPVGLYPQIGARINLCAERLMELSKDEEAPAPEETGE